ncbi:MAG TPA: cytochrome P460 family protein [Steroidobacteraceae bacterium]|nr:cytochrome P460 family protein [Steroidobacteraceae bacterium]
MRTRPCTFATLFGTLAAWSLSAPAGDATRLPGISTAAGPHPTAAVLALAYTPDGRLKFPQAYREWVYLSSGLDMSYRKGAGADGQSVFDNVFASPAAYREFLSTGTWPDGTLLVLEQRGAQEKGSINQSGRFQSGDPLGVEVHVKDTQRFPGGWAFFEFAGTGPGVLLPPAAECYACHREHGVVDTTFVQFYPTLLKIAKERGTVRAEPAAAH